MLSQVQFIGNAGSDPKVNVLPDGKKIGSITAAMNKGFGDKKRTVWVKIKGFDKTAERIGELTKGGRLCCYGDLDEEVWTDQHGVKHSQICIVANRVFSLEKRPASPEETPW